MAQLGNGSPENAENTEEMEQVKKGKDREETKPDMDFYDDSYDEDDKKKENTPKQEIYYTFKSLIGMLVVLVLLFTFVGRLIVVDGSSMEPSLWNGEMMVVRSLAYTPKQGDIVVLAKEGFHGGEAIVKRVIATGGQTVNIDYASNTVYIDGQPLDEPYIKETMVQQPYQTISSITVPLGSIFVMGDNRNGSDDSRDEALGVVDARLVLGEAIMVVLPFKSFQIL